jgi:pyridoxine kinase
MGKCSLTIALPIISVLGIEAVALPTALLSAHTVFDGYTFYDATNQMENALNHFNNMGESFDCIYTGYLGNEKQIDIVSDFIDKHPESLIITDPVMGDNGRLYSGFNRNYPEHLMKLCEKSDVLIPNLTEACLMANTPFVERDFSQRYINEIISKLCNLAPNVVVTGVKEKNNVSVYTCKRGESAKITAQSTLIERQFHGTGDVFASTLSALLTMGKSLEESTVVATKFTELAIQNTARDKDSQWYGLRFEPCLHMLYDMVNNGD